MDKMHNHVEHYIFGLLDEEMQQAGLDRAGFENFESTNLLTAGILDSVRFIEMIAEMEEQFGVEIDFERYDPDFFLTPAGLIACITESRQLL